MPHQRLQRFDIFSSAMEQVAYKLGYLVCAIFSFFFYLQSYEQSP